MPNIARCSLTLKRKENPKILEFLSFLDKNIEIENDKEKSYIFWKKENKKEYSFLTNKDTEKLNKLDYFYTWETTRELTNKSCIIVFNAAWWFSMPFIETLSEKFNLIWDISISLENQYYESWSINNWELKIITQISPEEIYYFTELLEQSTLLKNQNIKINTNYKTIKKLLNKARAWISICTNIKKQPRIIKKLIKKDFFNKKFIIKDILSYKDYNYTIQKLNKLSMKKLESIYKDIMWNNRAITIEDLPF